MSTFLRIVLIKSTINIKTNYMIDSIKISLRNQFGATIGMIEAALEMCPESMWNDDNKFWYNAYHGLFYLDYYLTVIPEEFTPPMPFDFSEFDPAGRMPDKVYDKNTLLEYCNYCRNKCYNLIDQLDENLLMQRWKNSYRDYSIFEVIIYNMRHVQHHTAQLNLLLRQGINNAPTWISNANK